MSVPQNYGGAGSARSRWSVHKRRTRGRRPFPFRVPRFCSPRL